LPVRPFPPLPARCPVPGWTAGNPFRRIGLSGRVRAGR